MKLWQSTLAVGVAGVVVYVGYRVVKGSKEPMASPIDESKALDKKDEPVSKKDDSAAVADAKLIDANVKPRDFTFFPIPTGLPASLDRSAVRSDPRVSRDTDWARWRQRDSDIISILPVDIARPSRVPLLPIRITTSGQRVVTDYGDIAVLPGESYDQAIARIFRERPDVAEAHRS